MFGNEFKSAADVGRIDDLVDAEAGEFGAQPVHVSRSSRLIEKLLTDDLELFVTRHAGVIGM